ncbi:MAG TPA: SUMF1/EgtB/PvdO family nonheme iron enzyme, partial [Patescibacteria group bacterium]|nr:SUMF1/EgtB/PvdO family nonheme iron enzyme [Patescibacteria group bacterium]
MRKTINLKKKSLIGKRELIVMITAVVLTTAGIKASDTLLNPNESAAVPSGPCEESMVLVTNSSGNFCIDKYEAAPGKGCPYQDPSNQTDTRLNLDYSDCKPESRPQALPWRFISQNQAAMACAKAGKRLPTNNEWLSASLGTPDINNSWSTNDCQVAKNWQVQPGASGSGENCKSSAGAY